MWARDYVIWYFGETDIVWWASHFTREEEEEEGSGIVPIYSSEDHAHTNRDHLTLLTCYFITTITDTKLNNYLGSALTVFTWQDGRYAHAQMDRGGADSCAFGRGWAESTTFDLKS